MQVFMFDTTDLTMFNMSYEEFGIKEMTSISCSGSPGGSAPPGSVLALTPSTSINYTSNTQYYVTIAIPDLHFNGDDADPRIISATEISIHNIHSLAAGNSDISALTPFTAPDMDMNIWGIAGIPVATPVHGEFSAGPGYSDYTAAAAALPFEYTIIDWEINVPVGVAPGVYKGTITLTITSA